MPRSTSQACPAWALRAWPPLLWQAGCENQLRLRHIETRVTHPGDQVMRTAGQTMWVARSEVGEAGVAWDWIQLSRGIVALADPLSVVTNLRLVDPEGAALSPQEMMLQLNMLVNELPWQTEVERALLGTVLPLEAFG
jgi:hypothetical protein